MPEVTGDAEQGDLEARFREALEKDRRQAEQLRQNARAVFRALQAWLGVGSQEEWLKVCEESQQEYESGQFLLERLGAERRLEPKLLATLLSLRRRLMAELGITTAAETMLVDLAILSYYHTVRAQRWIGDLALLAYTGEAEHRDRSMVNAPIGGRDRSEATLVGRSAVELALLSP